MRQHIKDFVSMVAANVEMEDPIYEFGSLRVQGQEDSADLRPLFPGHTYVGADLREGPGVDTLLDLHHIDLPSESVGTVLCLDTLEHVEYPQRAIEEIHRVLSPEGLVVISSVMDFPIHDYPHDYWRFTPEAFKSILKPFHTKFVGFAGKSSFPHTVVGLGFKRDIQDLSRLEKGYRTWRKQQTLSFYGVIKLLTPPLLFSLLSRLRRQPSRHTKGAGRD